MGHETVPVLLFVDSGPSRAEQILSDIRRNESRSARSQGILCDARDETARITRELTARVEVFADMTETVRSTISNRSFKLFTLSGIYHATGILLAGKQKEPYADRLELAVHFWSEVSRLIPDWRRAKAREVSPADLRKTYVHAHAIAWLRSREQASPLSRRALDPGDDGSCPSGPWTGPDRTLRCGKAGP